VEAEANNSAMKEAIHEARWSMGFSVWKTVGRERFALTFLAVGIDRHLQVTRHNGWMDSSFV
jgi:hypothetical protein